MSRADAWMPLYIGDYLSDTMHISTAEHGAYLLLLMHQWRNGPLPDDDKKLAAIARADAGSWKRIGPSVRGFFEVTPEGLSQKRLAAERAKAEGISDKRRAAGAAGAGGKWGELSHAETRAQRLANARRKATHTHEEWAALLDFTGMVCVRCKDPTPNPVKDHIEPIYQGGSDGIENLQPLCRSCNASKGPESIDHRPNGWQNAVKMPGKCLANASQNACEMPGQSQSHSQKQEKKEVATQASPARPTRGSRLPADWRPEPDEAGYAHSLGLDPQKVTENFRDYWHAKAGRDATKLDWSATWRGWCRRDAERKPANRNTPSKLQWWIDDMKGAHQ